MVVVLAIVLGAVWLVGGRGGGGTPAAGPSQSPVTAASPTPSPSSPAATPTPSVSTPASPKASPKPSASVLAAPACKDSDISVTVSTDAASYPVGATPKLRMQITNTSSRACTRDVGALPNTLIIDKGGVKFWSSDDCSPGGTPGLATLAAGQSYSVNVTWPAQASAPGCPSGQPAATAGSYTLIGRNGKVRSAPSPFSLT